MPKHPLPDTRAPNRSGPRQGTSSHSAELVGDLRSRLLRLALLPATAVGLLGAITASLVASDHSIGMRYTALCIAVGGFALIVIVALSRANAAATAIHTHIDGTNRDVQQRVMTLRASTAQGTEELQRLVHQVRKGESPRPRGPVEEPAYGSDLFAFLAYDLQRAQASAEEAVVQSARLAFGDGPDQRVAVFVNVGRRLQSLVHRAIQKLDELERQVEDPDLLKGLFNVDNVTTRVRRHAESLAVLGGAVSRRQWSKPVDMYTVLRSAVAEVEHYARVKVVQPIDGTVRGHAIIDIIHLIAELVENATTFSAPDTQVILHAQRVTAGLAIEVQDRGLGMSAEDQQRMNNLLAEPTKTDLGSLLQDGRIGLYVVAELARRHGVKVRLQTNIFGGIDALVVVPKQLLGEGQQDQEPAQRAQPARQEAIAPGYQVAALAAASSSRHQAPAAHTSGELAPMASRIPMPGPNEASGSLRSAQGFPAIETTSQPLNGQASPPPMPKRRRPAATATASSQDSAGQLPAGEDARPPLPKRGPGGYMAPELRGGPSAPSNEPVAGPNTGLMAAFQRGINRSTDEDAGPIGRSDHSS